MGFKGFWAIFGVIKGSRWRKASKCKKLIKQLRQSLVIQKNRRNAMMRQLRADIVQLLQNGQHKDALARVLQLHKDEHKLSAYDHIEKFSDCVDKNLNDINSHGNLPVDVCEAVSSLIFAASRCGELPELHSLRKLFKELLGEKFEKANVELLPGNTVNSQIKESLNVKSVAEDVKIQLINDIAREYKQHSRQPIQVQARALSKDGNNGIKDQTRAKKFEEMLPDIGPKYALRDCEDMATFWSNSHDGSDCIAGSFTSKEANTVTIIKKNHEDSLKRIKSNGTMTKREAAPLFFHDKEELYMQGEDVISGHKFTTLDSCKGFKRSSNRKAVDAKCNYLIKTDSIDARYDRSVAIHSSENEAIRGQFFHNDRDIRAQCHVKDTEEIPRSPITHVHPKLPYYDDLVVHFENLKKEYMQKNSNKIPRSPSTHVHPKLPYYDDLVVHFENLKKEYMQKKSNNEAPYKWLRWNS